MIDLEVFKCDYFNIGSRALLYNETVLQVATTAQSRGLSLTSSASGPVAGDS